MEFMFPAWEISATTLKQYKTRQYQYQLDIHRYPIITGRHRV